MPAALTDPQRQEIIDLLPTGKSCNEIATATGRSTSTVSKVARSVGHRFAQAQTAKARETRSAYGEAFRADLEAKAMVKAMAIVDGFDDPQPVVIPTPAGGVVRMLKLDARGQKDRAAAAQILVRTALDIARHDRKDDRGLAAVDAWLRDIAGATAVAS